MVWCNSREAAAVQEAAGLDGLPTERDSEVNGKESKVSYRVR